MSTWVPILLISYYNGYDDDGWSVNLGPYFAYYLPLFFSIVVTVKIHITIHADTVESSLLYNKKPEDQSDYYHDLQQGN